MALYLIGLGLNDENDISLKGLELARESDIVYLESYTGKFNGSIERLSRLIDKKIRIAERKIIENNMNRIINEAKEKNVAMLVMGDVFSATTHINYLVECKRKNIKLRIIHSSSIFSAVAISGLHLYKFGKTASVPFPRDNFHVKSYYNIIEKNLRNNTHTLVLLDIDTKNERYMGFDEALKLLLETEKEEKKGIIDKNNKVVVCAKLGSENFEVLYGRIKDLLTKDLNNKKPHCIIIPSKNLHFSEEEALEIWKI